MWVWYSGVGMWWMREEEEESKDTFCCAKEERKREEGALLTKTRWKRGHLRKCTFTFGKRRGCWKWKVEMGITGYYPNSGGRC